MENHKSPLQETTNATTTLKRSKSDSASHSVSIEETERDTLIESIKNIFLTTKSNKLKFELSEILKYLRGEEITEVIELKKVIEELLIENSTLLSDVITSDTITKEDNKENNKL